MKGMPDVLVYYTLGLVLILCICLVWNAYSRNKKGDK